MLKPLIKEINTSLDAFSIYSLFKEKRNIIFLDSAIGKDRLGKYSFIGLNPFITFKFKNNKCILNDREYFGDAFEELNAVVKKYEVINDTDIPFVAGGMGYFSYDLGRSIENIPSVSKEDVDIPDCYFNFYDNVIIVDHVNEKTYISALGILQDKEKSIKSIEGRISLGEEVTYPVKTNTSLKFSSNFTKDQYINSVKKVIDYIKEGHIYITNLTQRFHCNINKDSYEVYKTLRRINPAPFASYLKLDEFDILSSSPERFLKISNNVVETRPIKGTRPRGKDEEENLKNRKELLNSEKDKSELLMIVDLERNDLSKVCRPNSVKVTELFKLEEYSTVYHLVSTVIGELKDKATGIDCFKACFPGGSITGAPKIRSMEIIDEIEGVKRNIYTGAIGYIGFDNNLDFNIVIRTILMKDNKAYLGVGGGITYESNPEDEYQETLDKAKALFKSLEY